MDNTPDAQRYDKSGVEPLLKILNPILDAERVERRSKITLPHIWMVVSPFHDECKSEERTLPPAPSAVQLSWSPTSSSSIQPMSSWISPVHWRWNMVNELPGTIKSTFNQLSGSTNSALLPYLWQLPYRVSNFDTESSLRTQIATGSENTCYFDETRDNNSLKQLDVLTRYFEWEHPIDPSKDTLEVASILISMSQDSSSQILDIGMNTSFNNEKSSMPLKTTIGLNEAHQSLKEIHDFNLPQLHSISEDKHAVCRESTLHSPIPINPSSLLKPINQSPPLLPRRIKFPDEKIDDGTALLFSVGEVDTPQNKVRPPPPLGLDSEGRLVSKETSKSHTEEVVWENQRSPSWNYLIYGMLVRSPTQEMTLNELFSSIIAWCPNKKHRNKPRDDGSLQHALTTCNKFVNITIPRDDITTGKQTDGRKGLWRIRNVNEVAQSKELEKTTWTDEANKKGTVKRPLRAVKMMRKRRATNELENHRSDH
ncbi:hypothetical protein B7463_g10898, partial [Scytalidium lignicola]